MDFNILSKKWDDVLRTVKERRVTVHAWLVDGEPYKFENGILYIVFKNSIHMEVTKKPNNTKVIEEVLNDLLGQPLKIECILFHDSLKEQSQPILTDIERETYSVEILFVLDNGTKLTSFDTLVNMMNIDEKYIIREEVGQPKSKDQYFGRIYMNGNPSSLVIQIYKFSANQQQDIVYKINIFSGDIKSLEEYIKILIDIVHDRKHIKHKYLLWDGISQYFCKEGYYLINKVENKMRSFITEFLCRKIGQSAFKSTFSIELKESIKNNQQKTPYIDFNTYLV